ncbi:helix-turn-helix domain-containing protein [Salinirubellus salinus]|uniref:Helix-turn-helix domain-containing protein n=1 Tax=Salinirubellus salinus TaxID=1364945 RepID=A0A9E7UC12_9EURY|nr:helix-turn-helix domain-containing protein [Salinirubellus salinus]UWM55818.1 helix-turn-helix domain-containing protein [Salinirubellus salinus]
MIAECLVVEFRVTDDDCPLADATREVGTSVDAQPPLLRRDGNALLHFSSPSEAVGEYLDEDDRIRYLHRTAADGRWNYRCLAKEACVVHSLVDVGFLVDSIHLRDGTERFVGAVVGQDVLDQVLAAAGETVGVSLERISSLRAHEDTPVAQRWDVTPRQSEAVEAAFRLGYFSVPREVTARDVADELGISKSAFLERLRRAQATFFGHLFDDG